MMRSPKLTPERLSRRAVIYVRQSSLAQVLGNLESQRRQYELAQLARDLGFDEVLTIDDDQGRTASGKANRPGFLRLVAELATGNVGAVFCLEASRLARNGRDWHVKRHHNGTTPAPRSRDHPRTWISRQRHFHPAPEMPSQKPTISNSIAGPEAPYSYT
jgi:hypothetical protein